MVFKYISILGIEKVFTSIFPNIVNLSHRVDIKIEELCNTSVWHGVPSSGNQDQ